MIVQITLPHLCILFGLWTLAGWCFGSAHERARCDRELYAIRKVARRRRQEACDAILNEENEGKENQ